ncbi:MAG: sugar phosphate isomerase/epimerase [Anaerolineales bacterium]|nr:sugar phosphate isomerase/epimerase [Anaerolineales bacterium]
MQLALAVQTPDVTRPLPVALLSGTWSEKLDKAARLGVDGLELMTADPAQLDAPALRAGIEAHGLTAAAIGSGAAALQAGLNLLHAEPDVSARAVVRLHELIAFAAAVGAPLVTIGSFRGKLACVGKDGRARLVDILRQAAEVAAAAGVRLALEPLNRYEADLVNTAEEGLAFVETVGHPALGLLLDTYHVNIEEASWEAPFRRVMQAGKLWHVHLGDNNRLSPGDGMIDFAALVRTLHTLGYAGCLSAELLALPDPDTAAHRTVEHMRPLLEAAGCA